MRVWRGLMLWGLLVAVGCGGPPPEETPPEGPGMEEGSARDKAPPAEEAETEDGEGVTLGQGLEFGRARRVRTLLPPSDLPVWLEPAPESLVDFRGRLFFALNEPEGHKSLWRSDGSWPGTVQVRDFPPSMHPSGFFDTLGQLTPVGTRLFFVVGEPTYGQELWVTDGTPGGTRLVKDITPGVAPSFLSHLTAVRGVLVFFRVLPSTETTPERTEVWRSDGTPAGTVRVRDLGPGTELRSYSALLGHTLLFVVSDPAHGAELWRTDGTAAGTGLVRDIHPGPEGSSPFPLKVAGGQVVFTASTPAHGAELWRTDGTAAGTVLLEDLTPGPASSTVWPLGALGRYLFYATPTPSGDAMHLRRVRLDGSSRSRLVTALPNPFAGDPDAFPFITPSTQAGTKLFFGLGISTPGPAPRDVQLWVTDGTADGTRLLHRPLSLSDEFQPDFYAVGESLLFAGFEPETKGLEPWVSDGTRRGTRRLQNIAPGGASSYPYGYTRVGDSVFFVAHDETNAYQLWLVPLRRARD